MLLVGLDQTKAADHLEATTQDANQDIGDLYAWMDSGAANLNLILTTTGQEFNAATQYAFHVHSGPAFLNTPELTQIICQFEAANSIQCWVGDPNNGGDFVEGDPTDPVGLTSESGAVRVFAGVRNDPFFFNLTAFQDTVGIVNGAAGGITLDANGCPLLDTATAATLRDNLTSDGMGGGARTGVDSLAGANVTALVVQVNKELVTAGGSTLAVWASTHSR